MIIDPARQIFTGQCGIAEILFDQCPLFHKALPLRLRAHQLQLFDIIQRISDLMRDPQCDQNIRRQIGIHVRMQIRTEFRITPDIRLDQGPGDVQLILFRLAHQSLGYGRNAGLHFDPAIRIYIGRLGPAQSENVELSVVGIVIARDRPPDDLQPLIIS